MARFGGKLAARRAEARWRAVEQQQGCFHCGRQGCRMTMHPGLSCRFCGDPYCSGDRCSGNGRRKS